MTDESPNTFDLEKSINEFMGASGGDNEWKTIAKYAHQLSITQIKALCKLQDIIHILHPNKPTRARLTAVYETYMEHMPNYRTALYMLQMQKAKSLGDFLGKGIEGKIQYDIK